MGILEIILFIIGGLLFVAGFVVPARKEGVSEETKTLAKNEIEALAAREMEGIKGHVEDVVEEAVGYTMEKTERSLERLTNEKIMAVSEYSDTVLQEIHRNHEEVMFLYDMLNSKHANLKHTVTEIHKTVKEAEETTKEAEAVVSTIQKLAPETLQVDELQAIGKKQETDRNSDRQINVADHREISGEGNKDTDREKHTDHGVSMDISFTGDAEGDGRNCNERILEMYKQGRSKVAIAKELGLGVGEVKLVIDLYRNT